MSDKRESLGHNSANATQYLESLLYKRVTFFKVNSRAEESLTYIII